ncbi:MAG: FHA domain-containing protein [Myxococcota bacterium]
MGFLTVAGSRLPLRTRHLIGRSKRCDLHIPDRKISSEHAVIWWSEGQWQLKDLGSRNGTRRNGAALAAGAVVVLQTGDRIHFGDVMAVEVDTTPPTALAFPQDGGPPLQASGGILALPDESDPALVLYATPEGPWVLEQDDTLRPLLDEEKLVHEGRAWTLSLPEPAEDTVRAETRALRLPDVRMRFFVSQDEERVEVLVEGGGAAARLGSRSHLYPLLLLARARMAQPDDADGGWLTRDELCRMMRMDRKVLNVQFYRVRKQLSEVGVLDVGKLLERRSSGQLMRLSVADVVESPLSRAQQPWKSI